MKIRQDRIKNTIDTVDEIIQELVSFEEDNQSAIEQVDRDYAKSARNLIHYLSLRHHDLRSLQKRMRNLGLSRLAHAEAHVMASLQNTRFILGTLVHKKARAGKSGLSIKNGRKLLITHTKELLGYRSKGRRVRIMVTQPTESATNYALVLEMVKSGMNCARVNCAHDDQEVWLRIIKNVQKAGKVMGRKIKISMDLAGPKIRTGPIVPGGRVRKFTPERDEMGNVINPALMILVAKLHEESDQQEIPVDDSWLSQLKVGDEIFFEDTRQKKRKLKVIHRHEHEVLANCYDTSYIGTGTLLAAKDPQIGEVRVGEMPPLEQSILLRVNDVIRLTREKIPGQPAKFDEDGNLLERAFISCEVPEVFARVKVNEVILFDDGKIEGLIEQISEDYFDVRITRAKESGSKLKAEKGINFPTTDLGISGLTDKDKDDLKFVARHADIVNFSFVNQGSDVADLLEELDRLDALNQLSIILKIETRKAFDNLSEILLCAMQVKHIGVMIARGDLAVETGWDNIGWVQKEILSICNAAHVPVVWATQVLENLAKKGLPSRSEITDATTSLRAECVMLNKGAYVIDAIRLLDKLLIDMETYNEKNESMLPQMEKLL